MNDLSSKRTTVTQGIPQGSVPRPILFALYTSTYMYADNTTIYCVGETVDKVTAMINRSLRELTNWCKHNSLQNNSQIVRTL